MDKTLGEKIKQYRLRSNLSQFELESKINASNGTISRIENNTINPTKETLLKLIDILNLNVNELLDLFGIKKSNNLEALVKSAKELNKDLNLDHVLQSAVNEIVYELGLSGSFIVLKEGDKLYSKAVTQDWVIKLAMKFIPGKFTSLSVDIDKDQDNLMVKSFLNQKEYVSNNLHDFIVPAVNRNVSDTLTKFTGMKSAIVLPIILNNKSIGSIYFSRNNTSDFKDILDVLKLFTEHISLAIENARKYEELSNTLNIIKHG